MAKQPVKGEFCKDGSYAKIDGAFTSMVVEVIGDGYVFEDPTIGNKRRVLPKEEFEQKYELAQSKATPATTHAKPPSR